MPSYRMLVDGVLVDGPSSMDVIDPALAAPFAKASCADAALLDRAIAAAGRAFPVWSALSIEARQACLARLADRLEGEADHFASLLVREQGKPFPQAMFEVAATIRGIRHFASCRLDEETRPHSAGQYRMRRVPLGVVGCIMPWNFPMILAGNKYGPALLAGNTVILKPAPTTPLTTLELGRIAQGIFPPGVFNVIVDRNDLGQQLAEHPGVAKISFTGSTGTGKRVMASAAGTLKRLTLELGGNDAAIVLGDADLQHAVDGLVFTAFLNAGQICAAPKRIYVVDAIYDEFAARFAEAARGLKVGPGCEEGVQVGPLQNAQQFAKVQGYIAGAARDGRVIAGGRVANRPGYFIEPTVVRDIAEGSALVDEEQFGPVIPIIRARNAEDALARANRSRFGLGASIWSRDVVAAERLAWRLEAGTVWINQHIALAPDIPFAGAKESGLGIETGPEGILEFTRIQVLNSAA